MQKKKQPKPETPQRYSWKTSAVVDTYIEAVSLKEKLSKNQKNPVKIHLQREKFHVKVGEPVKVKQQPQPTEE